MMSMRLHNDLRSFYIFDEPSLSLNLATEDPSLLFSAGGAASSREDETLP